MRTGIIKRMRLFLLEKEDIFSIKLYLLMDGLSKLSFGSSVSSLKAFQKLEMDCMAHPHIATMEMYFL